MNNSGTALNIIGIDYDVNLGHDIIVFASEPDRLVLKLFKLERRSSTFSLLVQASEQDYTKYDKNQD